MELEKRTNIEGIDWAIIMPIFLDVFNDSFQKSGLKSLIRFLNRIDCKKWNIFSDYAFKGKENDTITFSIVPYIFEFDEFKKVMNEFAPTDLKHARRVNGKFLGFLRNMPIMHISIVLSKKRKLDFSNEKKFLLHKTKAMIAQLIHWCETTPEAKDTYVKQIKNFQSLEVELNKNSPNLSVIRDIEIIATLVSYLICEMSMVKELEIVGWFSDRDTILSYMKGRIENPIVFDLISIYTFGLSEKQGIAKRPSLAFGIPEESGVMWYDELNRLPDYIAGAIADYNIENNTVSKQKIQDIIEGAIATNANILCYKLNLLKSGSSVSRISIEKS